MCGSETPESILTASDLESALRRLQSPDWMVREQAAHDLGELTDERATSALLGALNDADDSVRESAAMALGPIEGPPDACVTARLLELLAREDFGHVREAAAGALYHVADAGSIARLGQALSDESLSVRHSLVFALWRIGLPECLPYLREALDDEEENIRKDAREAIDSISDSMHS